MVVSSHGRTKNNNSDSLNNGVNNDKYLKIEITERPVTIKPRRLNAKLGHNYKVSVPLKHFIPLSSIRSLHSSTYEQLWYMFIFQDLKESNIGKYGNKSW